MAHNDDHFQAILAAPDDDAPRLVYADWLDEHGDHDRAEFIRVQCALDKMPANEPKKSDLQHRERELLNQHGWAWAEPLGALVSEWKYRRGFVECVQMNLETTRDEIVNFLSKAPIRHIRDIGQFCELEGVVAALPYFKNLTGLEFWGLYAFEDSLLEKMLTSNHLKNLRTLILHHDRNGNLAKDKVIIKALQHPSRKKIEELGVNIDGMWRGPSCKVLQALADSPHLRKLKKLYLTNAGDTGNYPQMNVKTLRALGQSPNLAGLKELDLGQTSFSLEGWDEVLKWPFLPQLEWLRLHYARQVDPPELFTVAELVNLDAYRSAFEDKIANIDWHSEFVTPWDGNASWKGLSWTGLTQQHLFNMWPYVKERDYTGLEKTYRADCVKYAGEKAATAVDELPFQIYQKSLSNGYSRAVEMAKRRHRATKAIFLRMRPDLQWTGDFGLSNEDVAETFEPYAEGSYTTPTVEYDGGSFVQAAAVRDAFPPQSPLDPGGVLHYLIARTVATFGRFLAKNKAPVPVYFSCMYAVFRMS